jgi:hypothetical protein
VRKSEIKSMWPIVSSIWVVDSPISSCLSYSIHVSSSSHPESGRRIIFPLHASHVICPKLTSSHLTISSCGEGREKREERREKREERREKREETREKRTVADTARVASYLMCSTLIPSRPDDYVVTTFPRLALRTTRTIHRLHSHAYLLHTTSRQSHSTAPQVLEAGLIGTREED